MTLASDSLTVMESLLMSFFSNFSFGHVNYAAMCYMTNVKFSIGCFCNVLNYKDHVFNRKPLFQSHLVVSSRFSYCLCKIDLLVRRNVYDMIKSIMTAH